MVSLGKWPCRQSAAWSIAFTESQGHREQPAFHHHRYFLQGPMKDSTLLFGRYQLYCLVTEVLCELLPPSSHEGGMVKSSDILVLKLISVLVFILFSSQNFYFI